MERKESIIPEEKWNYISDGYGILGIPEVRHHIKLSF